MPGELEVYDFVLPSNDVLPSLSYAEFNMSDYSTGPAFENAVVMMKEYGQNIFCVHPVENPKANGVDDYGNITQWDNEEIHLACGGRQEPLGTPRPARIVCDSGSP